jgi:hypothetical protein
MSALKLMKSRHLSQTEIPRPPYLWKSGALGLVQRIIIEFQVRQVGLFAPRARDASPCLKRRVMAEHFAEQKRRACFPMGLPHRSQ